MRDGLERALRDGLDGTRVLGDGAARLPHVSAVTLEGVEGEALLLGVPKLAFGTGSACASATLEPSPVLRAMGLPRAEADTSVRFGLGRFTSAAEVDARGGVGRRRGAAHPSDGVRAAGGERPARPGRFLREQASRGTAGQVRVSPPGRTTLSAPPPSPARALLATIDHTALAATTTRAEIDRLCAEAREHGFAGVCVPPSWLARAEEGLRGSPVLRVTVIGFPLGHATTAAKVGETRDAVRLGADEIDMVIHLGLAREGRWAEVERDVRAVVEAAEGRSVKAILETALFDREDMMRAARAAQAAGVTFVKTSTGFGPGGATVEAVRWLREAVGPDLGVKASGGIRSLAAARAMLGAGATRLGTSSGVAIARELSSDTGSR